MRHDIQHSGICLSNNFKQEIVLESVKNTYFLCLIIIHKLTGKKWSYSCLLIIMGNGLQIKTLQIGNQTFSCMSICRLSFYK